MLPRDRHNVKLQRKTKHRLEEIARRLEILGGYLIAYLNIDEVIKIIREQDEPKPVLIKRGPSASVEELLMATEGGDDKQSGRVVGSFGHAG